MAYKKPTVDEVIDAIANEEFPERQTVAEIVAEGDTLKSLVALRDFIAYELDGNRCSKCHMSQMRTGDIASLVLRLQKLIEEIAELQRAQGPSSSGASREDDLAALRKRRGSAGNSDSANSRDAGLGSKAAPRQQNGRKPRIGSG